MTYPAQYYIIVPSGSFWDIWAILRGKTGKAIPDTMKAQVDQFLYDRGEWTDDNQFPGHSYRPFILWTIDGKDRVVVERHE